MSNEVSLLTGIVDKQSNYSNSRTANYLFSNTETYIDSDLVLLDLPMNINGSSGSYISIYFRGNNKTALYAKLPKKLYPKWDYVANIEPTDAICEIVSFKQTNHPNIFVIDTSSKFIISGHRLERYASNGWQYAQAGTEIIKFKQMKKLQSGLYEISHLIRGLGATEEAIQEQKEGDIFVFLEKGPNIIRASENLKNQQIAFKANNIKKNYRFSKQISKQTKTLHSFFNNKPEYPTY